MGSLASVAVGVKSMVSPALTLVGGSRGIGLDFGALAGLRIHVVDGQDVRLICNTATTISGLDGDAVCSGRDVGSP